MKKAAHVNAIFSYDDNVDIFLDDALAFYTALFNSPGNTHVTIPIATQSSVQGRLTTATGSQSAVKTRTKGLAATRNVDVQAVITDVQNFVAQVQTAVNNAPNALTAIKIVLDCGLFTRKITSKTKPPYNVEADKTTAGEFDIIFKAAARGVHACYETQESTDGINFVTVKTSPDSRYVYIHGKPSGTKLWFRGRVILSDKKGGAQAWLSTHAGYIFVP